MYRRSLLCVALLGLLCWPGTCVRAQRLADRLIVRYTQMPKAPAPARRLADGVVLLTYADSATAAGAYRRLRTDPSVDAVQFDHRVTFRAEPDDPLYARQENLARAGFPQAWDLTTGGATGDGYNIVTAVLDGGFDVAHEDLVGNLWVNPGEVAGDGIDNDGNGLVDDVNGYNYAGDSGTYTEDTHGTAVAGLLGAVGDNGLGITGGNWSAQLMLLEITTVSDIIAAYQYIIDRRVAFNTSGGARGDLIVSTNASFGIEGATCAEFPVWGSMYDRLAEAGILTAASVSNVAENVDTYGDMPTDCPSDGLIAVANAGIDEQLHPSSAFGPTVVDLAAPGEGSYSTRPGDRYSTFGGTSAAAPYVTAAISLLYATPCPTLQVQLLRDPAGAARRVREALLATTVARAGLAGLTVTGGTLDVYAAQQMVLADCVEDLAEFSVTAVAPNPSDGRLTVFTDAAALSERTTVWAYDTAGRRYGPLAFGRGRAGGATVTLDLSGLAAGAYVVEVVDGARRGRGRCIIF